MRIEFLTTNLPKENCATIRPKKTLSQTVRQTVGPQAGAIALLLAAMLSAGTPAYAQVQAGRIVGTVYDPQRAVVPQAALTITNAATNISHQVVADSAGDYAATSLDPGIYNVTASAPGFRTTVRHGVELQVGQALRLDFDLTLGEVATQVEVTSRTPLLSTETGTLGQGVTNTQIVNLPLNGRSFYELAKLTPGSALLPGGGNLLRIRPNFISGTTMSGVRGSQTTFLEDGVDVSDQHQGGTFIQTSIDALLEFSVQQSPYSAEYSRAGGFFNVTTKSGTSAVHGNVFEFLRNDKLDARNFFAQQREVLKRNQFGGTLGGPVVIPGIYNGRDRTFFFVSYEGTRERQGLVFTSDVPTAAMRLGDFSAPGLNKIYDPLTTAPNLSGSGAVRQPFAGNIIKPDRISAQARYFNDFIPLPNAPFSRFVYAPSRALDLDQVTLRGDQQLGSRHHLFSRYSFHDNRQNDPNRFPALGVTPLRTRGQNLVAAVTSNFRPNLIHEFRFNYLFGTIRLLAFQQGTDFNQKAGIKGFEDTKRAGVAGSFPDFAWSGYSAMQGSAFDQRPKTQDLLAEEIYDTLTWVKGKHILKFGTKIRYNKPLFTDSKQYVGSWFFNGNNTENPASAKGTGDAFADWLLGFPRQVTRAYPGDQFGGIGTYWQFFAQDDLKVSRRLTLTMGLRYEYSPWLKGYRGQVGTFDPTKSKPIIIASETDKIDLGAQSAAPVAFPLFQDVIQTSSQAGLPLSITYPDKNQWAPRLGFAWRPVGDRTVVRGGYGIFYETENTDGRVNLNMVPFKLDETVFNNIAAIPNRTLADPFLGAPLGSASAAPSLSPTYVRMRRGYDQHWNLGIQQQFAGNLLLEVDYVGNKGSFLNSGNAANFPSQGPGPIQKRRPFPRFGPIGFNSQDASDTYHALQEKFEKRLSSGFWFLQSYTYSKSTYRQNTPSVGGNTAWEKALSGFDIPHNFAFSTGYELPFGAGKYFLSDARGLASAVLGGWQAQTILIFRSGLPYTPVITRTDNTNTGIFGQRPNRIGTGRLASPTLNTAFDKSAFLAPSQYTYGNSGANILRGMSQGEVDLSIFKQFHVSESSQLQFRVEFFNLTNTPYFSTPNSSVDTVAGGQISSTTNAPRQIQFALKYNF